MHKMMNFSGNCVQSVNIRYSMWVDTTADSRTLSQQNKACTVGLTCASTGVSQGWLRKMMVTPFMGIQHAGQVGLPGPARKPCTHVAQNKKWRHGCTRQLRSACLQWQQRLCCCAILQGKGQYQHQDTGAHRVREATQDSRCLAVMPLTAGPASSLHSRSGGSPAADSCRAAC